MGKGTETQLKLSFERPDFVNSLFQLLSYDEGEEAYKIQALTVWNLGLFMAPMDTRYSDDLILNRRVLDHYVRLISSDKPIIR